ncbi:nitroreductase family deazaflavin-dependent oxidoreductase [Streptomyces sp. HU2014]|uniref:nitroreductase family deazaflavin-dependent oxidoreductase n=1 Tax=Streptomyces sp. HU2014 TaxID=2939414 RepID=UPI002010BD97|nr:nitroreductase family deazaflavin-dependent oxidoreductase [Streptomyces sp. HU2014]UQI43170.1 nitroreductase family deazaflavin-dependent oxidoreductase [Streptomyces sp. HU2014]
MTTAVERIVRRVSSTRTFAKIAPHFVPALDRAVHRLTHGRRLLSGKLLPSLVLTARGAKSGQLRRTPLACMREGDPASAWVVVGSNFGRPGHPAWTGNLLAHPDVEISWKGRDIPVRARLLRGAERDAAWAAVVRFWPPYARYQARVEREIRLFRLVPRDSVDPGAAGATGASGEGPDR